MNLSQPFCFACSAKAALPTAGVAKPTQASWGSASSPRLCSRSRVHNKATAPPRECPMPYNAALCTCCALQTAYHVHTQANTKWIKRPAVLHILDLKSLHKATHDKLQACSPAVVLARQLPLLFKMSMWGWSTCEDKTLVSVPCKLVQSLNRHSTSSVAEAGVSCRHILHIHDQYGPQTLSCYIRPSMSGKLHGAFSILWQLCSSQLY